MARMVEEGGRGERVFDGLKCFLASFGPWKTLGFTFETLKEWI